MNVFHNFTCIYHDFDAIVLSRKLGDNIVTVTNNVLHTFLKIFAVLKCLPCFPIVADTGTLIKNFRITVILTLVICDIRRKTSNSNQCIIINQIQAST